MVTFDFWLPRGGGGGGGGVGGGAKNGLNARPPNLISSKILCMSSLHASLKSIRSIANKKKWKIFFS